MIPALVRLCGAAAAGNVNAVRITHATTGSIRCTVVTVVDNEAKRMAIPVGKECM